MASLDSKIPQSRNSYEYVGTSTTARPGTPAGQCLDQRIAELAAEVAAAAQTLAGRRHSLQEAQVALQQATDVFQRTSELLTKVMVEHAGLTGTGA